MLNLLKGTDHPLADPQRAAEIFGALPSDTIQAVTELADLLDSVRADQTMRPSQRLDATLAVDAAAQRHIRKLARDYMSVRAKATQENRVWRIGHRFWSEAVAAYSACIDAIDGKAIPLVASVRTLRTIGGLHKWGALRYLPLQDTNWRLAGRLYAHAERARNAGQMITPFPKIPAETSVEREYLRLVGFALAIPGALSRPEIEIADYLSVTVARELRIERPQVHKATYWIDLARGDPPTRRVSRITPSEQVRFIVTTGASERLEALLGEIVVEGRVPESAQIPEYCEQDAVVATMRHVAAHLSAMPPTRRQSRAKLSERLEAAQGFDAGIAALEGKAHADDALDFSEASEPSQWTTANVSVGGFEAEVSRPNFSALTIRALVTTRAERTAEWSVGVIRRLETVSDEVALVDVELLSRKPVVVETTVITDNVASERREAAIFCPALAVGSNEVGLVLRIAAYVPGRSHFEVRLDGTRYLLTPQRAVDRGADYEHIRCLVSHA